MLNPEPVVVLALGQAGGLTCIAAGPLTPFGQQLRQLCHLRHQSIRPGGQQPVAVLGEGVGPAGKTNHLHAGAFRRRDAGHRIFNYQRACGIGPKAGRRVQENVGLWFPRPGPRSTAE